MPRYVLPLLIAGAVAVALGLTWWTLGRDRQAATRPSPTRTSSLSRGWR